MILYGIRSSWDDGLGWWVCHSGATSQIKNPNGAQAAFWPSRAAAEAHCMPGDVVVPVIVHLT